MNYVACGIKNKPRWQRLKEAGRKERRQTERREVRQAGKKERRQAVSADNAAYE